MRGLSRTSHPHLSPHSRSLEPADSPCGEPRERLPLFPPAPPRAADGGGAAPQAREGTDPREAFERQLASEMLATERFRATLLAVLPTVAMLAFLAITSIYPDALTTLLRGKVDRLPVGLFLCAVAGFEFHVLYATEKMLRSGPTIVA